MFLEIFFLLFITYFFYQILTKFAKKLNLIDLPNERSSHNLPTIRGFGVVIFVSIGITLLIFQPSMLIDRAYLLSSILLIGLLGMVDDIKETPPIIKIATLILVYVFLYAEGFLITDLGVFLGINIQLTLVSGIIFSAVVIAAFTNAFNLIDGLDGLSGLIAIIIFVSFLSIGIINNDLLLTSIPVLFITTLSVFIFYNWNPAKVFLGDSGSLMIGFVISILAVRSINYIEPISIIFITAVPIIDAVFVTFRRILEGRSPFHADKYHCHHILLKYFDKNVKKTVIVISIFQLILSLFGVFFVAHFDDGFISLLSFILGFYIIFKVLNKMKNTMTSKT
jgi:UDP-GlcNAc:undecaprenyl-phosphate GlcNAc-1-phosphate transferase